MIKENTHKARLMSVLSADIPTVKDARHTDSGSAVVYVTKSPDTATKRRVLRAVRKSARDVYGNVFFKSYRTRKNGTHSVFAVHGV